MRIFSCFCNKKHIHHRHSESFHPRLVPKAFTTYSSPSNICTSFNGPTVDTSAWSLLASNVATATAIASSKLLLIAVKLCVAESLWPKPVLCVTSKVKKKMVPKYTISEAVTRTIWFGEWLDGPVKRRRLELWRGDRSVTMGLPISGRTCRTRMYWWVYGGRNEWR